MPFCRGQFGVDTAYRVGVGACRLRIFHLQVQEKPLDRRDKFFLGVAEIDFATLYNEFGHAK